MKQTIRLSLLFLLFASYTSAVGQGAIAKKTAGMVKYVGYFDLFWENKTGKLYLEVDRFNEEFLLLGSLPGGVGSNDIGLDRGQLGADRIVKFMRSGNKVLLIQPNYRYRAETDNLEEQKAVALAFAQSALWGFTIQAEDDNRVLIDITDFCLQDMHGVAGRLAATKQGNYKIDKSRSVILLAGTKSFPENTEIESLLTFSGNAKGNYIKSVAPTASSVTVRAHFSFIKLPDNNYQKREMDPRYGYFGITYSDYATPLGEPIKKRFIARHRLKKADPSAAVSEPVEPITYYLDRGTPEPIRSALLDGARWWAEAFEAAGFKNAFKVEMLPEDADPMDVRYNVIQWVHRSTRGWSYGASVIDPRTGEIMKGHVSLGSLRARQDYLLAEGLLSPYKSGQKVSKEMEELALARLRQLSAHEVGHTIGLMHNFAASTNSRASVMDYPHPYITLKQDGSLDLSKAYDTGIGEWDKIAITLGYGEFNGKDEKAELNQLVQDYIQKGYRYISDQDARPLGGAHPHAHLWDNGEDAVKEMERLMAVRAQVINNFSEEAIPEGFPMATLEEVFVPVYLMHRYQLEATSKLLGGIEYTYALRGDGQLTTKMVDASVQKAALASLLNTLDPAVLTIPERILKLIPPRPVGFPKNRETFKGKTGVSFDPLTAVENAAHATLSLVLHPERAARLVEFHARNPQNPSFNEVLDEVLKTTWKSTRKSGYPAAVQHTIERAVLYQLLKLASNKNASEQVRAVAYLKLDELKAWLKNQATATKEFNQKAHLYYAKEQIRLFQQNPEQFHQTTKSKIPAGSPIGHAFGCGMR
ncbi:MAG: zinc-dependent metalloprotease [Flammeovirgaceae bacterium]